MLCNGKCVGSLGGGGRWGILLVLSSYVYVMV